MIGRDTIKFSKIHPIYQDSYSVENLGIESGSGKKKVHEILQMRFSEGSREKKFKSFSENQAESKQFRYNKYTTTNPSLIDGLLYNRTENSFNV